jgi:TetR/AcrR family transcriptional regulator, regulator of biofilm formation and stress response
MKAARSSRSPRAASRTRAAAPAHQPRGVRRREELLEAVLRVVARSGVAAVTHRAVAREAGTSHRLTVYYFRTKEQMLLEAFRFLAERSLARTELAAREVSAARQREGAMDAAIDAVTDAVLGGLRAETGGAAAEFSLVLEIARQPALARDYAAWQERVEAILREHAQAFGSDDPDADARLIVAALRGFQLEYLARPGRRLPRAALRALVGRLLTRL